MAIAKALEPEVATPVGRPKKNGGKLPSFNAGQTRDKVAASTGMSGRTLEKASEVVEAAEAEPQKFGPGKLCNFQEDRSSKRHINANAQSRSFIPTPAGW